MQTIISENVKRLRKVKELTQWELAKLAGVSQATVSRIEDGGRVPRVAIIQKLAKALGQTPESLVKGAIERAEEACTVSIPLGQEATVFQAINEAMAERVRGRKPMFFVWPDSMNNPSIDYKKEETFAWGVATGVLLVVTALMLGVGLFS